MSFSSGVMQISVGSKVISATSISVCGTTLNAGEIQKAVYRIQNCDFELKEYGIVEFKDTFEINP